MIRENPIARLPVSNSYKVYFGSALAVDGFGFVGRGTLTIAEKSIVFDGKKSWSVGAKIGIFLLITLVPLLLFGIGLGILPALLVVYYGCTSAGRMSITRDWIYDIRRKGRTISFRGINPDTGKDVRAIFLARDDGEAERLEINLPYSSGVPIG